MPIQTLQGVISASHNKTVSGLESVADCRCVVCGQTCSSWTCLEAHLKSVHDYYGFCYICMKGLQSRTGYIYHQNKHVDIIKCHICNKSFSSDYHLRRHMKVHSSYKDVVCEYCGKAYKERYNMTQHQKTCSAKYTYMTSLNDSNR